MMTKKGIERSLKHSLQYGSGGGACFGTSDPSRLRPDIPNVTVRKSVKTKTRRQDPDLKDMTPGQLRREVMRLRKAFRKELANTGNQRCWITLLQALPEGKSIKPLDLPREVFLANCARYHDRNEKEHDHSYVIHGRSHQTDKYPDDCMVIDRPALK